MGERFFRRISIFPQEYRMYFKEKQRCMAEKDPPEQRSTLVNTASTPIVAQDLKIARGEGKVPKQIFYKNGQNWAKNWFAKTNFRRLFPAKKVTPLPCSKLFTICFLFSQGKSKNNA